MCHTIPGHECTARWVAEPFGEDDPDVAGTMLADVDCRGSRPVAASG